MRDYCVDKQRVHATGNGTVLLVAREPQLFASCVPVCGGVDFMDALRLRDVPIWAFHGDKDPIIPVEGGAEKNGEATVPSISPT
jgi:predicted peptidase